ncbi:hypothetical protein JRQ81_000336 [Phrynocephalus forsythii]|uniref:Uncharacterized protein n=1 Tax=Phrynocephalus forsythii TaxID=171643 RepID=A0A9Q1B7X2_9SAUR|nr:hypothetical protein JRQ81_000336 [Phrynocephalus forsythii]
MAPALRLALLACWLAKVESPSLKLHCASDEYDYAGHCCRNCPAGTYVREHCYIPHTWGDCRACEEGEDYTEHDNGLEQCLPCKQCKSGNKIVVRPCTTKSNTVCQCRDGYYCPPGCEECLKCKKECSAEGQIIVHRCNATTDAVCGSPPEGTTQYPSILIGITIGIVFLFLLFILGFIYKRRKTACRSNEEKDAKRFLIHENVKVETSISGDPESRNNALFPNPEMSGLLPGSTNEDSTSGSIPSAQLLQLVEAPGIPSGHSNVPEGKKPEVRIKNSSTKKLSDIYFNVKAMVRSHDWNPLMRKCGLSDIDIDKITRDHPHDTHEQYHQMLRTLQDRLGIEDALHKLLDGLWDLNLKTLYENITNELADNDIITVGPED